MEHRHTVMGREWMAGLGVLLTGLLFASLFVLNNQKLLPLQPPVRPSQVPLVTAKAIQTNMTGRCFITYELANWPHGRRLGNHLFDTAAVLVLAKQHNMTALLPKGARILRDMDVLSAVVVSDSQYKDFVNKSHVFKEINNRIFDNKTTGELPCNVTLHGYYQSWRYLVNYTHIVRKYITFKPQFLQNAQNLFKKYQWEYYKSHTRFPDLTVGIHARTGISKESTDGYVAAPVSYYHHAMDYFRKLYPGREVAFIVSSDNIRWCRSNIKGPNVFYSEAKQPAVDMALQSLCDETITTMGSFTWWCAFWAGGKHTTYYKGWVKPGSRLEKQVNQTDMFYPNWVAIS